ncbi:MAG: hypothetical protein ACLUEQ_07545 [Cloacibacillus evryensis]
MKKVSVVILVLSVLYGLGGAGFFKSAAAAAPSRPWAEGKALVVYFSMPETGKPGYMTREEDNSTVVIGGKVLGNTQYVPNLSGKIPARTSSASAGHGISD